MGFKSSNFVFRQTALGEALSRVGLGNGAVAREPLLEGFLRDRHDRFNVRPSQHIELDRNTKTEGAFGHEDQKEQSFTRREKSHA